MAEYALPPGAVRRRTVFGLLDADGWAWATLKATFWFLFIIFVAALQGQDAEILRAIERFKTEQRISYRLPTANVYDYR